MTRKIPSFDIDAPLMHQAYVRRVGRTAKIIMVYDAHVMELWLNKYDGARYRIHYGATGGIARGRIRRAILDHSLHWARRVTMTSGPDLRKLVRILERHE